MVQFLTRYQMKKELKVLMMGGQRVGKSSVLAAIINAFVSEKHTNVFSARDKTKLEKVNGEKQASIESKLAEVKQMLANNFGKTILVNSGKTNNRWDYKLELSLTSSTNSMAITFTDVNGEFFEGGNKHQEEIIQLVQEYDVFIVAIDTPFMMAPRDFPDGKVDDIINDGYNCIESIHTFLSFVNDKDGTDPKLVIFVPIKCERWAREGRLIDVTEAVKKDYDTPLVNLRQYKSVQIEFLPVQTVGSAIFAEHLDAEIFEWSERKFLFFKKDYKQKCGSLPNGDIRLSGGKVKKRGSGIVKEDMEAVIPGTSIMRPNSWFKIDSMEYKPHNCEQLAYHILEFILRKAIKENAMENGLKKKVNTWAKKIGGYIFGKNNIITMIDLFGQIPVEMVEASLKDLKARKSIKYSGEGILIENKI